MALNRAASIGLVIAGVVLVLFFPDLEVLWFQGRPLGVVLIVLGAIDVANGFLRRDRPEPADSPRTRAATELREDARELRDDLR